MTKTNSSSTVMSTATPSDTDLSMLLKLYESEHLHDAEQLASSLIKKFPTHSFSWKVLGIVLSMNGKLSESLAVLRRSVQLAPQDTEAHSNLGVVLQKLGELDKASICYQKAISLNPNNFEAHNNLGGLLQKVGKLDEAEKLLKKAITLNIYYAEAYNNLGITLQEKGQLENAKEYYEHAILLKPKYAEAHSNLGDIFKALYKLNEAETYYKKSVALNPVNIKTLNNLGNLFKDLGKLGEAEASYRQALAINPNFVLVYKNLGLLFTKRKQYDKAKEYYNKAILLDPDFVDAKFELALLSIHESQFSSGFELYETRYHPNTTDRQAIPPKISTPQYQGKDLSLDIRGKHLLICSEQGVGDEAMFASVLPELAIVVKQDPNTRITLACEPRLVELFNRSFDFLTAIPKPENHEYKTLEKELDYWIFVGSLPKLYRNKIEDFHNNQPYLIPDQSLVNVWNTRFNTLPHKINIGISWRGGRERTNQVERSLSLEKMRPILSKVNQNANIINLQYGDHQQEIQSFTEKTGITIFDWEDHDPIKDLNNFAAQISALDLVISIDNSTVHFSGAVGTEVYVLLPFNQDWRWLDHSTDSYWYPNLMTLFRQHSTGVWDDVLNDVSNALDKCDLSRVST